LQKSDPDFEASCHNQIVFLGFILSAIFYTTKWF